MQTLRSALPTASAALSRAKRSAPWRLLPPAAQRVLQRGGVGERNRRHELPQARATRAQAAAATKGGLGPALHGHRCFASAAGEHSGGGAQHPNIGTFSSDLDFVGKFQEPFVTYRVLDDDGNIISGATDPNVDREQAARMFETMVRLNVMDSILYEAQRQGRLSFYMTNYGEEATHMGSAAALTPDDVVFGQYREAGVLLWRGFSMQEACDQCVANEGSSDKGRMMPVHYGSARHNFHTISSPLATQLPQAAGAAYALKMQGKDACVVCYFGDGAASEGDFHGALNFASTLECPVVFFCRNNGYAISTPISEQYKGDGIAVRGVSYNIKTARCDGNDVWAVYNVMKEARRIAVTDKVPVLVEAMTYRGGHHSTSDDATRYRGSQEVSVWANTNNPIARMKMFLDRKGWLEEGAEEKIREDARKEVLDALIAAEGKKKHGTDEVFTDVYDTMPKHLLEQQEEMKRHLREFGEEEYPILKEMM